jgi:hypothetical protein
MSTHSSIPLLHLRDATLVTSIGDDLLTTLAAFSSQRKRFRHIDVEGGKVAMAPARDIAGASRGDARLLALLQAAWQPMVERLSKLPARPTTLLLALPSWATGTTRAEEAQPPRLLDHIHEVVNADLTPLTNGQLDVQPIFGGAETSHAALAQVFRWLVHAALPESQRFMLLAADTLCDVEILLRDHRQRVVLEPGQPGHWIPGEAAACLVLEPVAQLRDVPMGEFALHAPALDTPASTPRWPSLRQGDGAVLHRAFKQALSSARLRARHIGHHVSDGDGSIWRIEDEMAATQRLPAGPDDEWTATPLLPADLLGQLGAATGAVGWALASGLHQLDLLRLNAALCSAHDFSGRCAANVIERSPNMTRAEPHA